MSEFDPDYWKELDSIEKFYYLGFLMADGYVATNSNTIGVHLSVVDIDWMRMYQATLGIDTKMTIEDDRPKRNSISCAVKKGCAQWKEDLAKYGIMPKKTGKETLPLDHCTSLEELSALILGYHDADFCISKNKDGKFTFSTYGTRDVVEAVNDVFEMFLDIEPNSVSVNKKSPGICSTSYSKHDDLCKIGNFLYTNKELQSHWLDRKYLKWNQAIAGVVI